MNLFSDIKLNKSWNKTKKHLQAAKCYVPTSVLNKNQKNLLKEFDDYFEYNEFGLAFDQLELLAETIDLPHCFWEEMFSAAKEMKLTEKLQKIEITLKR